MRLARAAFAALLVAAAWMGGVACCKECDTPDAGTTTPPATTSYSCQALADDAPGPACIGGPTPANGGPAPDPSKRFPLGCRALGATGKPGVTQNCTCEATSAVPDGRSPPVWACPT